MKIRYDYKNLNILSFVLAVLLLIIINTSIAQDLNFSSDSSITTGYSVKSLVSADFNNDNALDIAITINNDAIQNPLAIFMNDGSGIISTSADSLYANANYPAGVAAADFNNDNNIDLAYTIPNDSSFAILMGNGDGTFSTAVSYKVSTEIWILAVSDFNNDNNSDIVVASRYGFMFVSNGNGDGSFNVPVEYNSGGTSTDIEADDLNGDGFNDIIVGVGNTASLSVFLNDGNSGFPVRSSYYTYRTPGVVETCYFNSDTIPDIIVGSGSWNYDNLMLMSGDTSGSFTLADTISPCSNISDISVGDYNADGYIDVLVGDNNGLYIVRGSSSGYFAGFDTIAYEAGNYRARCVKSGDINSDGKADLIIARDNKISIYYGLESSANSMPKKINLPESFKLYQNYPNPFNPKTVISYKLPVTSEVNLSVLNVRGQKVATLISKTQGAGNYKVDWNIGGLSSGSYYFKLTVGNKVKIRKMIILK